MARVGWVSSWRLGDGGYLSEETTGRPAASRSNRSLESSGAAPKSILLHEAFVLVTYRGASSVLLNDNAPSLCSSRWARRWRRNSSRTIRERRTTAKLIKTTLAALIILPFILLPHGGWVSDRFSKRNVIVISLWAQFVVMGMIGGRFTAIIFRYRFRPVPAGVQCAFFSPAKQASSRSWSLPRKSARRSGSWR